MDSFSIEGRFQGFELGFVLINVLSEILERRFMCGGSKKIIRIVKLKTEKLRP